MPYRLNNMNAPDIPGHFFIFFLKKCFEKFGELKKNAVSLHSLTRTRAFSSAGLEHLPYKQRVGGSNPSTPTRKSQTSSLTFLCYMR